ncbi:glycoside hydrolase superfamily [Phakopsora pachyrhizi]|uniref:Glycoside hydrolase superfamily n=1 Tax=Phakopsora pachyrhizi TaxID=170000 RepID=A0AAV0BT42_PHAPC|nr:glycoside hydrolase superfamily [Phakopsora pachyrhizi]
MKKLLNRLNPPPVPLHTKPGYQHHSNHNFHHSHQKFEPVLAGYYANWTVYSKPPFPPSNAAYYHLNRILYAFAKITSTGDVSLSDPWGDIEKPFEPSIGTPEFDPGFKGNLGEIAIMKHRNKKLRCQLSIGGAGAEITQNFRTIVRSENAMRKFAWDCQDLCQRYGFDGIDVDYEHPENEAEGRGLLELLRHIRGALDHLSHTTQRPERYLLTVATGMGEWSSQHLPLREMDHVLDCIYLMTYDASGSWDKTLNHHAPLFGHGYQGLSADSTINFYHSRGVPLHKLILGVPLYSRSFMTRTGICGHQYDRVSGTNEEASGEGTHMYNVLPRPGSTEYHDQNLGTAWCFDGKEWCSYDTPTTMGIKADYVKRRGLGGVFYWDLAGGHVAQKPPHPRDLVATAWQSLFGGVSGSF